ncbi:Tripartite-type tricarboxylate transporter, receptor component TctC [Variovorax sp. CF079]|uniref:Bug family tripartite tricarboxylate transporter substrate binding protein n=1 Tax=Variovorax sp. CF079 TaxID=1882774 RepID=UPI00087FF7FA|nr:tripartite tricarboxylate transporter substrate binding protein [Variovorax sp. CF079]SDE71637.1 Tripartite-type tricarboxylate transporter, receptor component TctC [Variovorax sp. CF079]
MDQDMNRRRALACAGLLAAPALAFAQGGFPNRPLRAIVPVPPGGGFDFVARILADRMTKGLGQPVIVENRAGSGTLIGTDLAAKAAPDGYTLLTGSISNVALNMGLYRKPPYDSLRDFDPVGLAVSYSYVLVARPDLQQKSLAEVIAYAKANPARLTYASAGNGSGQHVLPAALWRQARVEVSHIPYRGVQAGYQDLLGGRVDLLFDLWPTARTYIEGARVTPLAVSGTKRQPTIPDTPTLIESGYKIELESWFGFFTQAKVPAAIKEKLRSELERVIASREVSDIFRKSGGTSLSLSTAEMRELVRRDVERWSRLVRELGISPD